MNIRELLFGRPVSKTKQALKDEEYKDADARLKKLAEQRASMRRSLADAMRQIVEDPGT